MAFNLMTEKRRTAMMPVYRYDTRRHTKIAMLMAIVFLMAAVVLMMWPTHRPSAEACRLAGMIGCAPPVILPSSTVNPPVKLPLVKPPVNPPGRGV